jgi:hypothetical protein
MSEVIFARPRYTYDSYTDMHSLIQLSGYPLVYFDEIDPQSDNCYIMTLVNGENQNGWTDARARIILYDLEWRLEGEYPRIPGVSEVWAADPWYAEQIGAQYVLLGSHPGLNLDPSTEADKAADVIMLAYMTNRRMQMAVWLQERGLSIARNAWKEARHNAILQSRAMLHVHQHDNVATVAPQRFALAAAYKIPMIAESVCAPSVMKDAVLWAGYSDLPDVVQRNVYDHRLGALGEALHQVLCVDHSFRKCVESAL